MHGIGWVLFGVGMNGAGWLGRLGRSTWFVGLEPRPEDLSAGSGVVCGSWAMPPDASLADEPAVAAEAEAFFAAAPVPQGWCAAIAVPRGIGPAETGAALGLTDALRARRDPLGRRLTVVVTIEEETGPLAGVLVRRLSDRGAFVICGGNRATGDHLHHFPLRATVRPRQGRLICVDLADFLHAWRPGRVATLQTVPDDLDVIAQGRGCALNILFHLDPNALEPTLERLYRLASRLCELLLVPDGDAVVTTADRLDGRTGSVDLLAIQEATVTGWLRPRRSTQRRCPSS